MNVLLVTLLIDRLAADFARPLLFQIQHKLVPMLSRQIMFRLPLQFDIQDHS